ncbi:MAG: hypothetical protein MJ003_02395 [Paludibacteraceae bacterium]|nr:hypothetical protein [Paludibacteraceae bacterium]
MNKKLSLACGILSIVGLGASIFVCTVEQSAENFLLAAIFFVAGVYFIYQYKGERRKEK